MLKLEPLFGGCSQELGLWRQLGHEAGVLMMGLVSFQEDPRSLLPAFSPGVDRKRKHSPCSQELSQDKSLGLHLSMDFLPFRTMRNMFIAYDTWSIIYYSSSNGDKTVGNNRNS